MVLIDEINRMQAILQHGEIKEIPSNWKIFYEYDIDKDCIKGFCFLFEYKRLPYKPDYNTGKLAEIEVFTFPEYRHQNICTTLVQNAIEYASEHKIDIIADCVNDTSYFITKRLNFTDTIDKLTWFHGSK